MGRPPKFTNDQILDAALMAITQHGPSGATVARIAENLGAPVGSIYHRFDSREFLLARLWLRTVEGFQDSLLKALDDPATVDAMPELARHVVAWCQENRDEARVLVLFRRDELSSRWPDDLAKELEALNKRVEIVMERYARRLWGDDATEMLPLLVLAIVDLPYACVRRYIEEGGPPQIVVDRLEAMARVAVEV